MSIDEILEYAAIVSEEHDALPQVISPEVFNNMSEVLNMTKYVFAGDNMVVNHKMNSPMKSMGYINITAKNLYVRDPQRLSDMISIASNFEIYPKTNGRICVEFTFHGLTKGIE